ncbi:uncharacterized protein LOC105843891 [Hydra vulgaris]|uniref:uncharacterized protein LOC105843891 n=1 Tax=Hydra vulgaris TaxID=6087 RepID=UPI001F5FC3C3|nr:uncharacterized protein LOC105843891 [Hydra vulgaris]
MSYELSDKSLEEVNNLGKATTMIGMLKYSDDFQKSTGSAQLWFKDTTSTSVATDSLEFAARQIKVIQKPATKDTFSFCIPLKHVLGFCDDYDKVIYGVKHSLVITRKGDNHAIFRAAGVAVGKVNLTKVSLFMKHICEYNSVTPNVMGFKYKLSGRNERPKYIFLALQIYRNGNQEVKSAVFDNCDLKAISVTLNRERAYLDSATFNEKFYRTNQLYAQSSIHDVEFRELYPIYVVNVSKQTERLKSSPVDI